MRQKIIITTLIFIIVLAGALFPVKDTALSTGAQENEVSYGGNMIRVGISTNDFSALEYPEVSVTSAGRYDVVDESTGNVVASSAIKDIFTVKINHGLFTVCDSTDMFIGGLTGPILIKSYGTPIGIAGLKRGGKQALYRGEIEIVKAPTRSDKLSVVNVLPLEEYLKGVVPNEMPVHFGLEALKAQAVAARNYAIKPRTRSYPQFDICDSVSCQVYFGYNTESPLSNQAVNETNGLLALYNGDIILALYSSTAGGYTENYENVFTDPKDPTFPAKPIPYLRGIPDVSETPALNNEEYAKGFYSTCPVSFDNASGYYRWKKVWTGSELQTQLNETIVKYYNPSFITPKLEKDSDIGIIKNIEVVARGVSGKAMVVKITTDKGEWHVLKELFIRRVFKHGGKMLPSANIVFNNVYDAEGNLIQVEAIGGGFGHGVGMSQYGAGYLSKNGYSFDQILQHYYCGISIGTSPVTLSPVTKEPVKQGFYSPVNRADLVLYNPEHLQELNMVINSNEIKLTKNELSNQGDKIRIPLDKFIVKGQNEVIFYTPDKKVKVWIEVFKPLD